MEALAESARDLMEKFSDDVGKNPKCSGLYVNLIIVVRSLEQIIYLVQSLTEDIHLRCRGERHPAPEQPTRG